MKWTKKTTWITYCCVTILVLLSSPIASADTKKQVLIVKSSENSYFNLTVETLINSAIRDIDFKVTNTDSINPETITKDDLVITLGSRATRKIADLFPDQAMISAYITQNQLKEFKPLSKYQLVVLLDQPLERYLAFSHYLLGINSLATINQAPIKLNLTQKNLLKRLNLNLNQYQQSNSTNLLTTIRQIRKRNDALLMLPNRRLFNRDTLKGILLTTYRNRTPVISYSPAHVKSGALASIYSSPEDIGKHLGDLLNQYLSNKSKPKSVTEFARYYSIVTNKRVAHSLGLTLPDTNELRRKLNEIVE